MMDIFDAITTLAVMVGVPLSLALDFQQFRKLNDVSSDMSRLVLPDRAHLRSKPKHFGYPRWREATWHDVRL